ncbi:hypothetical protein CLU79DRAFT_831404 [Phycomyces nitens]|nr:hypothetical protein CLU79DRAFT_831404 [Phycomyces nitens]
MVGKNTLFVLFVLLFICVQECYAPPLQQGRTPTYQETRIFSIIKTVVLAYLLHTLTIRSSSSSTKNLTAITRILFLAYPALGIGMASESISSAYYADKHLGINLFKKPLKEYEMLKNDSSIYKGSSMASSTRKINYKDGSKADTSPLVSDYDCLRDEIRKLRDWLVEYIKTNEKVEIKDYDNAPYLAALFHIMGRDKARKIKHCIVNSSLYIGFDLLFDTVLIETDSNEVEYMRIAGSGAMCRYQKIIFPKVVRYLSTDLLDELMATYRLDDTSYTQRCVTVMQIMYIVYECIGGRGDRWSKLIMIIYTIMSILQTASLAALHTQTTAYSIHYKSDITHNVSNTSNTPKPTSHDSALHQENTIRDPRDFLYQGSFLHQIIEEMVPYCKQEAIESANNMDPTVLASIIGGTGISLLLGLWADYNIHTNTEWIVLSWILSSFLFGIVTYFSNNTNITSIIPLFLPIIAIPGGLACVLAATIEGYPKEHLST